MSHGAADQPKPLPHFASHFSQTVLALLFGLTLRAALEAGAASLLVHPDWPAMWQAMQEDPKKYWFGTLQLTAFVLTLCRFYAGAYRFHQSQPPHTTLASLLFDAVWTLFLFVSFYIAALLVATRGLFLLAITLIHAIDFGWFLLGAVIAKAPPHIQKVLSLYLLFDVLTVLFASLAWGAFSAWHFDSIHFQWISAAILLGMFAIDMLWLTRDWYFK